MKKLCMLFAAFMTVLTALWLSACSGDDMYRVSERRCSFYTGGGDGFTLTAVSGVREDPYTLDGAVGALKPYTLVTLVPTDFDVDAVYTYTVKTEDTVYGGTLAVHPFGASFSAEFDAETTGELTIVVEKGGVATECAMQNLVTDEMLAFDRALSAAKNELKPTGDYEVRARLIKNPLGGDGMCWHIVFCSGGEISSVLLDPLTAKVLAKKQ